MDEEQVRQLIDEAFAKRDKGLRALLHHTRAGLYAILRAIERQLGIKPPTKNN